MSFRLHKKICSRIYDSKQNVQSTHAQHKSGSQRSGGSHGAVCDPAYDQGKYQFAYRGQAGGQQICQKQPFVFVKIRNKTL